MLADTDTLALRVCAVSPNLSSRGNLALMLYISVANSTALFQTMRSL